MKRKKLNINRLLRRLRGNRKHKDRLFQKVFERKEDLLALYNAVNHTSYTNAEELEITTLDDVIYLSMKNDLSFIISATLNLYEHQSTFNANMPIRGLLYFARLYEAYIKKNKLDIYGHKMIDLPEPRYIVFYNGRSNQPDEKELKLSDAFHSDNPNPVLECRARMININLGHNQELMESCKRLWDYSYFIAEVNQNLDKGYALETAIKKAMDVCIEKGILLDILEKSRNEVFDMLLTEYDEKLHMKTLYEQGKEAGLEEGFGSGYDSANERINTLNEMLKRDNRLDDLFRSFSDKEFQKRLLQEYKL